jgi:hypothetical protein
MVARDAYFWAWPMVNMYNRRLALGEAPEPGLMGGILPFAPLNRLAMLSDYVEPSEREVACPNHDVVFGAGMAALDVSPVVLQVPNFGARFWGYQVVDIRTDSFADIGAMYGTKPGFYLLVGPEWREPVPEGITKVFRAKTNTVFVIPRVFQDDTPQDRLIVQSLIQGIDMYPLSMYDGKMKRRDWRQVPTLPKPEGYPSGPESRWVNPETFFDQITRVLEDAHPLPGEEAHYAQVIALAKTASRYPALKASIIDEAVRTEQELISPLLEFRNFGLSLPHHWTTINNGAAFGTDYFTRTAVARSSMLVTKCTETTHFYQDLDASGERLNGSRRYTLTFPHGSQPPVRGFWSLSLYDQQHFFHAPNEIRRFSVGTRTRNLTRGADGSLTIYIQSDPPSDPDQLANWLPSPDAAEFSLSIRAYWPKEQITGGVWTPPAVNPAN